MWRMTLNRNWPNFVDWPRGSKSLNLFSFLVTHLNHLCAQTPKIYSADWLFGVQWPERSLDLTGCCLVYLRDLR